MDVIHPRCAGVDISKKDAKVCIRIQGVSGKRATSTVTTWTVELIEVSTRRTLIEKTIEEATETTQKVETNVTDKDEISALRAPTTSKARHHSPARETVALRIARPRSWRTIVSGHPGSGARPVMRETSMRWAPSSRSRRSSSVSVSGGGSRSGHCTSAALTSVVM